MGEQRLDKYKIVSVAQQEANKKNAQLGGVKTKAGKDKIKYNSVKHGLLSKELIIPEDDKLIFKEFKEIIIAQLQPEAGLEELLVERIITSSWRLKIAIKVEQNLIHWQENYKQPGELEIFKESDEQEKRKAISKIAENKSLENIMRYETTIERSLYRAINELRCLKKNGFVS